MRQWEIYNFPFPTPQDPHPCVIISPDEIADNPQIKQVNCLACQSLRGRDTAKAHEVRLNGADGLDGPTIVKCQMALFFDKDVAGNLRGKVSSERRRMIRRKLIDIFKLYES
jgi:hypothetical protein